MHLNRAASRRAGAVKATSKTVSSETKEGSYIAVRVLCGRVREAEKSHAFAAAAT